LVTLSEVVFMSIPRSLLVRHLNLDDVARVVQRKIPGIRAARRQLGREVQGESQRPHLDGGKRSRALLHLNTSQPTVCIRQVSTQPVNPGGLIVLFRSIGRAQGVFEAVNPKESEGVHSADFARGIAGVDHGDLGADLSTGGGLEAQGLGGNGQVRFFLDFGHER
jgi:hypothetical protein